MIISSSTHAPYDTNTFPFYLCHPIPFFFQINMFQHWFSFLFHLFFCSLFVLCLTFSDFLSYFIFYSFPSLFVYKLYKCSTKYKLYFPHSFSFSLRHKVLVVFQSRSAPHHIPPFFLSLQGATIQSNQFLPIQSPFCSTSPQTHQSLSCNHDINPLQTRAHTL